jgi:hypothetical protein
VLRRLLAAGAMAGLSLALTLSALDAVLRCFPRLLPAGSYSFGQRFDPEIGSAVYTGRVIYQKVRFTERSANELGFLDVEHAQQPPPRVARVGLFGDSYVEAAQVSLEHTFFRRLAARTEPAGTEILAFGISGWGTLHSYLAWRALGERMGLDRAVYFFVENDLGDNAFSIQSAQPRGFLRRPFAEASDAEPGFRVRWLEGLEQSRSARIVRACYERSPLARVVWSRLALLRGYGVAAGGGRDAVEMTGVAAAVPDQNDLPETWPAAYADEARLLGERILARWHDEASERGQPLLVVYVPRGAAQLAGEVAPEATWRPWLLATCARLGIPVLDLFEPLAAAQGAGRTVYDDHWAPDGHEVVAEALAGALLAEPGAARP